MLREVTNTLPGGSPIVEQQQEKEQTLPTPTSASFISAAPSHSTTTSVVRQYRRVGKIDSCHVSLVKWDSPRDRQLTQDQRYTWIGCDFSGGCNYWVHAFCGRFDLPKGKKLPEFSCPSHCNR